MKEALLGLSLALLPVAPPAPAATVTLEFDATHSWSAGDTSDSVTLNRESVDEIAVEISPANETCSFDDHLRIGQMMTLYISADGTTDLVKCEYRLLEILSTAATFSENCGDEAVQPPKRC